MIFATCTLEVQLASKHLFTSFSLRKRNFVQLSYKSPCYLYINTCPWTLSLDLMPYFGYILFDQKCKFWQQKDTKTFCLLNPEFEISNSITFCFLFLKTGICVSKPIFLFLKPGICVSKPIFLLLKPGICDFKPLSSTVMHAEFEV